MEREFLKSVNQLMLEGVPISPAELKELILRHLLSDPNDYMSSRLTTSLMEAYSESATRKGIPIELLSPAEVTNTLRYAYEEGYNHVVNDGHSSERNRAPDFAWPKVLPRGYVYPKDIIIQFGTALGYASAQSEKKLPG